jgi:hypothetical protein
MGIRLMVHNPCRDCAERRVGCHSGCEGYKRYLDEWNALKGLIRTECEYDSYMRGLHERRGWTELIRKKKRRVKDK